HLRHAEPGVPVFDCLRAAQHRGRPDLRLARSEDSLSMSVTQPDATLSLPSPQAVRPSLLRRTLRALRTFARRSPMAAVGGCGAAAIIVMAIAAPALAPRDPTRADFRHMTKPPSELHWFGTDQIGRDTLSRVIYGSRASLTVAAGAVLLGTTLGA